MIRRTLRWYAGMGLLTFLIGAGALSLLVAAAAQEQEEEEEYEIDVLGLDPYMPVPEDNLMSKEKIALGRQLFWDPRLSIDGTISCATCHDPMLGWSNGKAVATGVGGQKGNRSAPTVINSGYNKVQFWDGREPTLEAQALGPIQNPIEMGHTLRGVEATLSKVTGYVEQFKSVFGTPVTASGIAKAIAAFERTLLSGDSPVDRFEAGDTSALNESATRGLTIFKSKRGNCSTCHAGSNFTDDVYHNLGVGIEATEPDLGRWGALPKSKREEADKGAFKTPTLRDVALTAPYMHDGSEATLEDVIDFYDRGGNKNPNLDKEMKLLNLSARDKKDLIALLEALTGEIRPNGSPPPLPE
ncbi:MAG: cytochrome-c peroxidase [Planctomycetota bacterium]|nr:cytochrome-c peroxidase [Planctomycetota bacterium]